MAALVHHGAVVLGAGGVEEIVADVVFAQPLHAHRALQPLRQFNRFQHEIRLGLAAEGTAEQRRHDFDVFQRHLQMRGDEAARCLRVLHGCVDHAAIFADIGNRHRRFHRRVGEKRRLVGGFEFRAASRESRVHIALLGVRHRRSGLLQRR